MPHSLLAGLFGFLHPLFLPGLSLPERTQRHTRPMSRKQTTILGCKWLEFRRVCLGCLSRTGAPAVLRFSALILRSTEQRIYPGSCEGVEPQDDGQYAGENKGPGCIGSTTVVTGKSHPQPKPSEPASDVDSSSQSRQHVSGVHGSPASLSRHCRGVEGLSCFTRKLVTEEGSAAIVAGPQTSRKQQRLPPKVRCTASTEEELGSNWRCALRCHGLLSSCRLSWMRVSTGLQCCKIP